MVMVVLLLPLLLLLDVGVVRAVVTAVAVDAWGMAALRDEGWVCRTVG